MYAPVGYTPFRSLWDDFLSARFEAIYRSVSANYEEEEFQSDFTRGSPLDIAEHIFLSLMWKYEPCAVSQDGQVMRVVSSFRDDQRGLFTKIDPYHSVWILACAEVDGLQEFETREVAGGLFERWRFDSCHASEWAKRYSKVPDTQQISSTEILEAVRFHTLPLGFCRERFTIVERLPAWAKFCGDIHAIEYLVENLGGRPLCIANTKLSGWQGILDGKTPFFNRELDRFGQKGLKVGRPKKQPEVIAAYQKAFPRGHKCSVKEAIGKVEDQLGETVSESAFRRAIASIRASKSGEG